MKLAFFLNAGDSGWKTTTSALQGLDRAGADWVELCVPYANPFTDGAVIRASHQRALRSGTTLEHTLARIAELRPTLRIRIALMIDWSHSVRGVGFPALTRDAAAAGVDALFLHGAPPRLNEAWVAACADAGIQRVLTIYPDSPLAGQQWNNVAFIYLATQYGKAGAPVQADAAFRQRLSDCSARIRERCDAPLFFGFGINACTDVAWAGECGADGVVVGSRFVDWLHQQATEREHVCHEAISRFVDGFRPPPNLCTDQARRPERQEPTVRQDNALSGETV